MASKSHDLKTSEGMSSGPAAFPTFSEDLTLIYGEQIVFDVKTFKDVRGFFIRLVYLWCTSQEVFIVGEPCAHSFLAA